nr:hypothetical protein [Tanacetum cinerariifolium]
MADNRTMAQMLQAPIEGYEDAIVVPPINANNFELKQTLINLVQSNQFMGRQDPHNHLRFFNKVTSTFRHPEVPNTTVKKSTSLVESDIQTNATMADNRTMAQMLQAPIEGYEDAIVVPPINANNFELKQTLINLLDTFYNALNPNDPDALDSTAGDNFLDKIPRECLSIIESKSKVRYSRSRVTDVRANANAPLSSSQSNSFDLQQIAAALEDKLDIRMNRYNQCPLTRGGNDFPIFHDSIQQFQTAAVEAGRLSESNHVIHAESLQQTVNLKFFFFTKQHYPKPEGRSKSYYHQE